MEPFKADFLKMRDLASNIERHSEVFNDLLNGLNGFKNIIDEIDTSGIWIGKDKDEFIKRVRTDFYPIFDSVKENIDSYPKQIKNKRQQIMDAEQELSS